MDTKQKVVAFEQAIYQVMKEHGVRGITGVWFATDSDNYGVMKIYNITDWYMGGICVFLERKFEDWEKELVKTPQRDNIIRKLDGNQPLN